MLVVYFVLWYEMIQATARAGAFVCARACATSTGPFPRSFVSRLAAWSEVEARDVRLKRLQFDVVVKTFCDGINALLVKKKETEVAAVIGMANPSPAPAITALNNFNALNWKNVSLALTC